MSASGHSDRGYNLSGVIAPAVAACINMLLVLLICFGISPRIEESINESSRIHAAIDANRDQLAAHRADLKEYRGELQDNLKLVKRLNSLIDDALRKAEKKAKDDALRDKKDKGGKQ